MDKYIPSREETMALFKQYNKSESLNKHALAVESVMKHFAEIYNEDIEKWGIIGLIHDLDFERYPKLHCKKTEEILRENNWPEDYIYSVISHGWGMCTDSEPIKTMEKVLYTIDELTGLIAATALVRPSKSILDVKIKSVKKKWKQRSFAAGVDRELIEKGIGMLNMNIDEVILKTIEGMQKVADEIGLKGIL